MDYPRGPDRPFLLHEMQEGRRVALTHEPGLAGAVVGWAVADGALDTIHVRWDDGATDAVEDLVHIPAVWSGEEPDEEALLRRNSDRKRRLAMQARTCELELMLPPHMPA